jgi:hypothetical protein
MLGIDERTLGKNVHAKTLKTFLLVYDSYTRG